MKLLSLEIWNFRNLAPVRLEFADGFNVFLGENGQGKTNLLEAIAVLGNLRSFRTARARRLVRHGEVAFRIDGEIEGVAGRCRLRHIVEVGPPLKRGLQIDGVDIDMAQFLCAFPVFTMGHFDRELVAGSPDVRRAFLDRAVFLLDRGYMQHIRDFQRALRQRNAALNSQADDELLRGWERQLARCGAIIVSQRIEVVERLIPAFKEVYEELRHGTFPEIDVNYRAEASILEEIPRVNLCSGLEELYFQRYNESRARDRRAGFTFEGPHRHDLSLRADGRPVRDVLSSGQTKILAAALRLAGLAIVEQARGEVLPVIIDDIDAELDGESLSRLIGRLGGDRQAFLSSAHQALGVDDLIHEQRGTCGNFRVRGGSVVRAGEQRNE